MNKLIINAHCYHGTIFFDDNDLMVKYRTGLKDNEELTVTFEPRREYRSDAAVNLFNLCYERWAKEQNYERKWARDFMKFRHGVKWVINVEYGFLKGSLNEMIGRVGHFFDWENDLCFLLSTNAYTKSQIHDLIEGTLRDMEESQIDTSDLRQEWVTSHER